METLHSEVDPAGATASRCAPGLLQVWSPEGPVCRAVAIQDEFVVGREAAGLVVDDARVSRAHCRVRFDGALWTVEDLGSRNGTFIAGERLQGPALLGTEQVLRVGHCLLLAYDDVRGLVEHGVRGDEWIAGPRMQVLLAEVARRAAEREHLVLLGPSASGKRSAASHYLAGQADAPEVRLSSAALVGPNPEQRLLAAAEQAKQGVLVFDVLDELDPASQVALLTLFERGAPRLCVLTRHDPREALRAGRLREDLYFRLTAAQVELPALAERREEVPFHLHRGLARMTPARRAHVSLVERCLRLRWPGNIRELLAAARSAAATAQQEGAAEVEARHLDPKAGVAIERAGPTSPIVSADRLGDASVVEAALLAEDGNVRAAARTLGVHRNQLRRWLARRSPRPGDET